MLLLNIPPAYFGLLALLVSALATWRWFSQKYRRQESTPRTTPPIPPLPPMDLPNRPTPPVKTASRGLEPPITDIIPAIPEIPLSEEERRIAQEYLKTKA